MEGRPQRHQIGTHGGASSAAMAVPEAYTLLPEARCTTSASHRRRRRAFHPNLQSCSYFQLFSSSFFDQIHLILAVIFTPNLWCCPNSDLYLPEKNMISEFYILFLFGIFMFARWTIFCCDPI
uniref:Uncharacterized protein n=1 Tax=Arundo donax TaxID=35708 RepID=A0A0A8Z883_ARUDO